MHYEKFADGSVKCIEDEIPFEVPERWEWCRLGFIGDWKAGATPNRKNPDYYNGDIPWIKTGDLNDTLITKIPERITQKALKETSVTLIPSGTVLIAMYGATIGKLGMTSCEATTNQACCACCNPKGAEAQFLFYFLMQSKKLFVNMGFGGAQPNISKEKIVQVLFPIPPIEEQRRIISAIDNSLKYVATISDNKSELVALIGYTKSHILDLAIRGKLVPQDPIDGPASVLLECIRAEKEELIKQGKIKRDKKESIIFRGDDNSYYEMIGNKVKNIDNKIPFELPDRWVFVRLKELWKLISGRDLAPSKYSTDGTGIPYITGASKRADILNLLLPVPSSDYQARVVERVTVLTGILVTIEKSLS